MSLHCCATPAAPRRRQSAAAALATSAPPNALPPPGPAWGDAALDFVTDPLKFLERAEASYGGAVSLRLAGSSCVLVSRSEWAERILVSQAASFTKRGTAFFPGSSLVGNGLLVSDGDTHARQRRLSAPAFRAAAVASYAPVFVDSVEALLAADGAWGGRGISLTRDVAADFTELTLRITTRALFGSDLDASQAAEVNASILQAFGYFSDRLRGLPIPEWLPTPDNERFRASVARLDAAVFSIIAARRRSAASGDVGAGGDLLGRLMAAREDTHAGDSVDEDRMDDKSLRDELMTLLVAGQETAAATLSWACMWLAARPHLQEGIATEVSAVCGDRPPGAEDAPRLHVVTAVILETLRLTPPAYVVGRCAAEDVALGPYVVRAGTTVLVSPYLLQRAARHWPRPTEFDHTWWLDERGHADAADALRGMGSRGAYIPFGAGPRNCIGATFAMMEMVLLLAALSKAVRWEPLAGDVPPAGTARITLRPEFARLRIVRR